MHILIVDDKEENVYYLQALLQANGYTTEPARHGAEALVRARQNPPDAIISDLLMPVMDGYTLLRIWRADTRLKEIPFIVYTATYTEPQDERLALSLGADTFILKPTEPDQFLARLREVQPGKKKSLQDSSAAKNETELLKVYSETLIRKLEEKSLQLTESNRALQLDIAERQKAEDELRWKTAFLEAQVDSSIDGILVVDGQGKKILQNQRFINLWKIPPHLAEDTEEASQVAFIARQTTKPTEYAAKIGHLNSHPDEVSWDEIQLVDGTILDRFSSPVRDKSGRHYGRIWTFRDITEQRGLEAQFRQSQKMEAFGQLAGGVAHDFNNILAVIRLQIALLKAEPSLSLQQLDFADAIEKAAHRAANLTRQLLLFSRQKAMQPHDLDLKEVVESMAKMLHRTLGENIQLQFKFLNEPLFIHADAGMIDQILLNLAVNARDAMPKGGRIIIETSAAEFDEVLARETAHARPGSFVCLSVSDTGCGIPAEILPRIFEPFFTTKDVGKGTGLGLATVFGIVHQHQGWVSVFSEVDRGSNFRVYLPRISKSSGKKEVQPAQPSVRGGNETILLVEDEISLRSAIRMVLTRLGYRLFEAANGDEALALWKAHSADIHLMITDLMMPGKINGRELARQVLESKPELKVIYVSGYSPEIIGKDLLLEEGANFLCKPFAPRHLAETIRKNLDR